MGAEQLVTDNIDLWTSATRAKATQGRGSNKKRELYGIKKLRELILELAVRGKLVPQDPNDEPASEFLKRIADAKIQLIKDKKIKKTKILSEIKNKDISFPLPARWQWVKLGDLVEMYNGRAFKSSEWASTGLPIVRIQNLNNEKAEFNYFDGDLADHNCIGNGTFLISWSGTPGTSFGAFIWNRGKAALNQHINKCIFHTDEINLEFMKLAVNGCMNHFIEMAQGAVGLKHVTMGTLNNAIIGFPPLAEQERIVAKVDELMCLCDQLEKQSEAGIEAHQLLVDALLESLTNAKDAVDLGENWKRLSENFDTLITTDYAVEQLKQTILQLAVMGKLVPQNSADEPASELLARTAAEKEQLIKDRKIAKKKPLPQIAEEEKLFKLPAGWAWSRVWNIAMTITSGSRDWAKYYSNTGAIFVTMGNLSRGSYVLRMDNIRYVSPPDDGEGQRTKLLENDLLISITGDVGNLGRIPKNFGEAYINQHTALLRLMPGFQGRFVPEVMRSSWAKRQFDAPQRGIKNSFRLGDIGDMLLAIPPLAEQTRIVAKIDQLMALCDQLKTRLHAAQVTQLHMADAVVHKIIGEPAKNTDTIRFNAMVMEITTMLSIIREEYDRDAIIAPIIFELGGTADAKDVWGKTKLSLPEFYAQLKVEIESGYIAKPSSADFKEV